MSGNTSGWNRSTGNQPTKRDAKAPSKRKGLVAGLVTVIALGALCLWMFSGDEEAAASKKKDRGLIKEVTPAAAPKAKPAEPEKPKHKVEVKKLPNGQLMKYVDGKEVWAYPRQDPAKYGAVTSSMAQACRQLEQRVFDCTSDKQLAYLANYRPGDEFGDGLDTRAFTKNFLKSLETPIIVMHDDPENVAELKRGVIELRKELKARYDAGEDIKKLVDDTIADYQRMGAYKMEITKAIQNLAKDPDVTQEEMDAFVNEANKMLDAKGLTRAVLTGAVRKRIAINKILKEKGISLPQKKNKEE